jgi:hypothetical protein
MRKATVTLMALVTLAGVVFAAASSASIEQGGPAVTAGRPDMGATQGRPQLRLHPAVALRGHDVSISVTQLAAPSLEVRVAGATTDLGQPLPWTPLRFDRRAWRGLLPTPEFRGIYQLELRIRSTLPVLRSEKWLLRVFASGTRSQPAFSAPEEVAVWWVHTLPGHARPVAMKRWPQPAFDKRDHRRHQLLVVAYTLAGHRAVRDRLGMFVTAVRDPLHGRWRLLEATVSP